MFKSTYSYFDGLNGFPEKHTWVFTLFQNDKAIISGYLDSYRDYSYLAIQRIENKIESFPEVSKYFKTTCGIYGKFSEIIHLDIDSDKNNDLLERVLFIMTFKVLFEVEKELRDKKKLSFTYDFIEGIKNGN